MSPDLPRLNRFWITFALGCSLALPVWSQSGESFRLRIGGSELLGAAVTSVFESRVREAGGTLRTRFDGSRPAKDALDAGILDMAVLIQDERSPPLDEKWASLPIAHLVAFVVAPRDLNIDQISFIDLRRIFGAESAVASTRWGEFGATENWERVPISPHVTTPAEGLSYEIFRNRVFLTPEFKSTVRQHHTMEETLDALEQADGGIGILPWLPEDRTKFKSLLVTSHMDEVAFSPVSENLAAGDYPLAVQLNLVFLRDQAPRLLPWLKFWYGDEVSEALRSGHVMPLPRTLRNQRIFDLEVIHE